MDVLNVLDFYFVQTQTEWGKEVNIFSCSTWVSMKTYNP